jgi:hypothetical protein
LPEEQFNIRLLPIQNRPCFSFVSFLFARAKEKKVVGPIESNFKRCIAEH